jgi:hypothetical protein
MKALDNANKIRTNRAQVKRDLKAGHTQIIDLLLEPPEWMENMKVFDLILACPKYGRVKVDKILRRCRISPTKLIGELSVHQRTEVVSRLRR